MNKEKSVAEASSSPAVDTQDSTGKDLLGGLPPNGPLSPQGSKTPKQEPAEEACSTEDKRSTHTVTLTPKPEVVLYDSIHHPISERTHPTSAVSWRNRGCFSTSVGAVCRFE